MTVVAAFLRGVQARFKARRPGGAGFLRPRFSQPDPCRQGRLDGLADLTWSRAHLSNPGFGENMWQQSTIRADRAQLRRACALLLVAALIALSGCAARPGPETLLPVADLAEQGSKITLLTATNRALSSENPPAYGSERSTMSYEEFSLHVALPAAGDLMRPDPVAQPDVKVAARLRFGRQTFLEKLGSLHRQRGSTIMLFVHGYNNSYQEAVFRLAGMAAETQIDVVPVVFSWPSAASFAGYVTDRDSSAYARDDLVRLLTDLAAASPDRQVLVVGHSMGGHLVMEALRELRQTGRNDVIAKMEVGLASPDIDLDLFQKQAGDVGRLTPPMTVLVAPDDRALEAAARVAGGRIRLGAVDVSDPQVQAMAERAGVRLIDISALPASGNANHDRFLALAALRMPGTQDNPLQELRHTGAYVLGSAGRILTYGTP